jgi:hypothetical protein
VGYLDGVNCEVETTTVAGYLRHDYPEDKAAALEPPKDLGSFGRVDIEATPASADQNPVPARNWLRVLLRNS